MPTNSLRSSVGADVRAVNVNSSPRVVDNTPWGMWQNSTTSSTSSGMYIWNVWSTSSTPTVTSGSTIWTNWNSFETPQNQYNRSHIQRQHNQYIPPVDVRTPEQVAAEDAARAERTARWNEQARIDTIAREKAEKRAEELLLTLLTEEQKRQFKAESAFIVHGRSGLRYRIRRGRSGNVDVIERDGRLRHRLCAHPIENVPNCDTMAAQKLMLEFDDLDFSRRANIHHVANPGQLILPALMQ